MTRVGRGPAAGLGVLLAAIVGFGLAAPAWADDVVPSARAARGVLIRAAPDADAPVIEALTAGERAPLVGERRYWREIRLPDGRSGFVSKSWTRVEETEDAPSPLLTVTGQPVYRIHTVDVGTGLAIFVEGPDFALVYDGGSNDDLATGQGNRFLRYLKFVRPSLQAIDHMILSHPHRDHVELLPDLFPAYRVRNVWESGRVNPICGYRAFLKGVRAEPGVVYHNGVAGSGRKEVAFPKGKCAGREVPAETVTVDQGPLITGQPLSLGQGATLTFLYIDPDQSHHDPNENSLVARLDLGSVRILLTGDAEGGERRDPAEAPDPGSIEAKLLACCRAALKADVLFAGHHGSKTSSRKAFLDAVGAKVFIVSSGPVAYGRGTVLPDSVVTDEFEARGKLLRTDVADGACARAAAKIGPDRDGRAGGCDNVVITIQGSQVFAETVRLQD